MLSTMLPLVAMTAMNAMVMQAVPAGTVAAPEPEVRFDQGPMGIDLLVIYEQRFSFRETLPGNIPTNEVQMRFRLRGERIDQLVRYGNLSFDEAVDSTGKSLIREQDNTDEFRTFLRRANTNPQGLVANGLPMPARLIAPNRAATTFRTLKGSVRIVRAEGREAIVVVDPMSMVGKKIEHPRLEQLGIELEILPAGNPTGFKDPSRAMAIKQGKGSEKIDRILFCDEWLRAVGTRPPSERLSNEGEPCVVYQATREPFDDNTQMVIEVYQNAKDERIPFSFTDVELP